MRGIGNCGSSTATSVHRPRRRRSFGKPRSHPTSFEDYIGQTEVIANARVCACRTLRRLDTRSLFVHRVSGAGQASLAAVIGTEMGAKLRATCAPAIEHKGALASLLTTLEDGDCLEVS